VGFQRTPITTPSSRPETEEQNPAVPLLRSSMMKEESGPRWSRTLQPDEQMWIDVGKLIRERTPDRVLVTPKFSIAVLVFGAAFVTVAAQNPTKPIAPVESMSTFNPSAQKPAAYSDDEIRADVVIISGTSFLRIVKLKTSEEKKVPLPAEMAQVDEIRKTSTNRLIVRGMANGSTAEVAIVEPSLATIVDKFLCYLPAVSPSGRFIAFIKFYPSHFAEGTDDHYMLYDTEKAAVGNRPTSISTIDERNVGLCFYPPGCINQDNDNVDRPAEVPHFSKSKFFWNPHREEVLFADLLDSGARITLVLADVEENGHVTTRSLGVQTEPYCATNSTANPHCPVFLRSVEFRTVEASIELTFEVANTHRHYTADYNSSQFR